MALTPADDGFHAFGKDPFWQESWYYDWSSDDGSVAGFARQGYYANLGEAWFWLYLFLRDEGRIVFVRDHSVPIGDRWGRTEHRTEGLWWHFHAQEPLQAWSLQAEASGLEISSPREVLDEELGTPRPIGLDISFEAIAPPYQWQAAAGRPADIADTTPTSRFEQFGAWSGEILVGDRTYALDGLGERDHSWGRRDWWTPPWVYTAFNTGRDFAMHAAGADIPGFDAADGYVFRDGSLRRITRFAKETVHDDDRMPVSALYEYEDEDGVTYPVSVAAESVVRVHIEPRAGATGETLFRRGPATFETAGMRGHGDIEYNSPLSGPFA